MGAMGTNGIHNNNRANIGIFCEITKYLPEKMQFFYEFIRKSSFWVILRPIIRVKWR